MTSLYEKGWESVLPTTGESESIAVGYIRVSDTDLGIGFPFIITQWQVNLNEKVHVLESFNEHVHAYAFGKGVGTAVIGGRSLAAEGSNDQHKLLKTELLTDYNTKLRALAAAKRGRLVRISGPGSGAVFSGIATSLTLSMVSDPSSILDFQMNFLILDSTLGTL